VFMRGFFFLLRVGDSFFLKLGIVWGFLGGCGDGGMKGVLGVGGWGGGGG